MDEISELEHDTLKPVNISNEAEGSEDNEIITPETKSETFQIKIDEHEQNFEVSAAEGFESAINDFTEVDEDIKVDNEENENTAATSGIDEPIKNSNVVALKKNDTEANSQNVMKLQVI